ncbi:luciferin 4-monooxygenase-like [Plodia interpunctella]|uniref:luciferin 4-monooxygenase-like n=1 Tax=Plodia interpunctella TaxID=58824 RepID=UPI002368424D|nr:luciferin 4-monooxygenase-like [Plodia interpunctella]
MNGILDNFQFKPSDEVNWYFEELTAKVVADSGIPTDIYHVGKNLLRVFKDNPNTISRIDGAVGQHYTNRQVLEKSVKCATAFRKLGIRKGDVVLILAPNHLDLTVPFYACFYIGVIAAGIDRTLRTKELSNVFTITKPKIIFCQDEKSNEVQKALNNEKLDSLIITFDKGDTHTSFSQFLEEYGGQEPVEDFKATDFDPADTIGYLLSTSGSTGLPKLAAITHKNLSIGGRLAWANYTKFPECIKMHFNISPLQWQSAALMHITTPLLKIPQLITSGSLTQEHFHYLLRKYQPNLLLSSPNLMTTLLKPSKNDSTLLSCLNIIYLGGSTVSKELVQQIKDITPKTSVVCVYGSTEMSTIAFVLADSPLGCVGREAPCFKYKLVNTETKEVINEPNVPGELWVKGPSVFKGYYNNREETIKVFSEDGWLMTGDLLYRDEKDNYFFSDRQKFLLKYMNNQISPTELEQVIRSHPAVLDVVVTGRPDSMVGDLAVAVVVPSPGKVIKAEEIIDIVKDNLSESKQLRGGVVFLKEMPLLASGKIDRQKLKNLVSN